MQLSKIISKDVESVPPYGPLLSATQTASPRDYGQE